MGAGAPWGLPDDVVGGEEGSREALVERLQAQRRIGREKQVHRALLREAQCSPRTGHRTSMWKPRKNPPSHQGIPKKHYRGGYQMSTEVDLLQFSRESTPGRRGKGTVCDLSRMPAGACLPEPLRGERD